MSSFRNESSGENLVRDQGSRAPPSWDRVKPISRDNPEKVVSSHGNQSDSQGSDNSAIESLLGPLHERSELSEIDCLVFEGPISDPKSKSILNFGLRWSSDSSS